MLLRLLYPLTKQEILEGNLRLAEHRQWISHSRWWRIYRQSPARAPGWRFLDRQRGKRMLEELRQDGPLRFSVRHKLRRAYSKVARSIWLPTVILVADYWWWSFHPIMRWC